jgi:hypothetical protein
MSNLDSGANLKEALALFESGKSDRAIQQAFDLLIALISDDRPEAEMAARHFAAAIRRGFGDHSKLSLALAAACDRQVTASAHVLLKGLQGLLGDASIENHFAAMLDPGRLEVYDGLVLDRLLTAIEWQRSEVLLRKMKALIRRLEGGQLSHGNLGNIKSMRDFVKSQRKVTKVQKQQFEDLSIRLNMSEERIKALMQPYGVNSIHEMKNAEARTLIQRLTALASRHNADGITSRQINYIRRLIKKLELDDNADSIIAEEVAQKSNIVELSKEQGSMVIEWLLQQDESK